MLTRQALPPVFPRRLMMFMVGLLVGMIASSVFDRDARCVPEAAAQVPQNPDVRDEPVGLCADQNVAMPGVCACLGSGLCSIRSLPYDPIEGAVNPALILMNGICAPDLLLITGSDGWSCVPVVFLLPLTSR